MLIIVSSILTAILAVINLSLDSYLDFIQSLFPRLTKVKSKLNIILTILTISGIIISAYGGIRSEYDLINIKEYSYYSRLNFSGNIGGHILPSEKTTIGKILEHVVYVKNMNQISIGCSNQDFFTLEKIIRDFPKYPFGYFWLATCFQVNKNSLWIDQATQAIRIFKITTSIIGHNFEHDIALRVLSEELKTKDSPHGILNRFGSELEIK